MRERLEAATEEALQLVLEAEPLDAKVTYLAAMRAGRELRIANHETAALALAEALEGFCEREGL
jgi:hypothetical protein